MAVENPNRSSIIEGIKIKEKKDYYEYYDIKIKYNPNGSKNWRIISDSDLTIWMAGKQFSKGDTIASFKDGTNVVYLMMVQVESEGLLINWHYRVTGSFSQKREINYDIEEDDEVQKTARYKEPEENDEPVPEPNTRYLIESVNSGAHYDKLHVRKFVNNEEIGSVYVTSDSIRAYKVSHSNTSHNYLRIFRNLLFDWHGQDPEHPEDSYTFTLYSGVNSLDVNGITYGHWDTIRHWTWDDAVSIDISDLSEGYSPYDKDIDDSVCTYQVKSRNNPDTLDIFKIRNGAIESKKEVSANWIISQKQQSGNPPKLFENLVIDFNTTSSPSYTFFLYSNNDYIKYNGHKKYSGDLIESWRVDQPVDFVIYDESPAYDHDVKEGDSYSVKLECFKYDGPDERIIYNPETITKDEVYKDVFYDHKEMYYNGHYHKAAWLVWDQPDLAQKRFGPIAISYADPFWVLITANNDVTFNGRNYKAKKLLKMWKDDERVDLSLKYTQYRTLAKTKKEYDVIKYIIETAESNDTITVIKRINDLDDDTIAFDPNTDCPIAFHGIKFTCSNSLISLFANGDHVKLSSGSQYRKGSLMDQWRTDEKVYFAVTDDENKYAVSAVTTVTIKTEDVTNTDYILSTLEDDIYKLKIVKRVPVTDPITGITTYKLSGEEIIAYYDCIRISYTYDTTLIFTFDPGAMEWTLISANNNIYVDNVNYPMWTTIRQWALREELQGFEIGHRESSHTAVRLHSVKQSSTDSYTTTYNDTTEQVYEVTTQSDVNKKILLVCHQPGSSTVERLINTYDAMYNPLIFYQLSIWYDVINSEWELRSNGDDIYYNSNVYKKGKKIDRWNHDQMVDLAIDILVNREKHTERNDKEKNDLVEKSTMYLYGYIWKKLGSPGPTPTPDFDLLISICYGYRGGNGTFNSYLMRYDLRSTTIDCDRSYSNTGSYYLFYLLNHKISHGTRIFAVLDMYFADTMPSWGNLRLAWTDNFGQSWKFNMTYFQSYIYEQSYIYGNNNKYFNIHVCDRTHVYQLIPTGTMYSKWKTTAVRFLKYTIFDNGDLSTDIDEIITADESQYGYDFCFIVNSAHTTYIEDTMYFDNYCVNIGHNNDPVFSAYYDYDLLNHSVITVYRDALKNFQDYLNITYASYSEDGRTKTWIYFANYWYETYSGGEIYARTEDNRPPGGTSSPVCENTLNTAHVSFTIGSISFVYCKIKIHRTIEKNGWTVSTEVIEDLGNFVFRYDHLNKSVSTSSISDSEMIDLTFKLGYSLKYKGNYYGFVDFQGSILLSKLNLSTGTCEIVKTFESGSYILVKYFDSSSSYQNKFIKLYLVTDIADREYLTYDSANTYRCKIRPEELNMGGYETYSTVAAVHKINYKDSASNCNDKFIFKVANRDQDFVGAIFVFDNINLEGLNVAFRDDYYY